MFFLFLSPFSYSQNDEIKVTTSTKTSQAKLCNDFYAGYGALSIFYFTGNFNHSFNLASNTTLQDPQSVGSVFIGYSRSLNRVVSTGFLFGFQNFHSSGEGQYGVSGTEVPITVDDRLLMGIARVTFCYLNNPVIRMYSGVGIGITMDFGKEKAGAESSSDRKLLPGGQITLMGLRFGRSFGGFIEFGFGTYGIVNAGLSYKFAD